MTFVTKSVVSGAREAGGGVANRVAAAMATASTGRAGRTLGCELRLVAFELRSGWAGAAPACFRLKGGGGGGGDNFICFYFRHCMV